MTPSAIRSGEGARGRVSGALRNFIDRDGGRLARSRLLLIAVMVARSLLGVEVFKVVLDLTTLQAGLALLPMTFASTLAALAASKFAYQWGTARLVTLGIGLNLAGLAWFGHVVPIALCFASIAMPMVLIGIGQGVGFSPLAAAGGGRAGSAAA